MSTNAPSFNDQVIAEFRANQGRVASFGNGPLLLLHTSGARSGKERVHPMLHLDIEGRRFVFASKAGADTSPDWYHNLVAHPEVVVEAAEETYTARAVPVQGAERDRIYDEQARRYPNFAEYQQKTQRVIPVVELKRE